MTDKTIQLGDPVPLDLTCNHYHGEQYPFRVRFHFDALVELFNDALRGVRIYELMMIRRPGDVWNYVWVEVVELPPRAQKMAEAKYTRGAEGFVKFQKFDDLFRWADMDTEPEDECWLRARGERPFAELADQLFLQVKVIQARLRNGQDILTAHVLSAMESRQHAFDYLINPRVICTLPGHSANYHVPKHPTAYYEKLEALLATPQITSVGFNCDNDFPAIRLACTEQRKRANATGQHPHDAFFITMLSDGLPYVRGWGAEVHTRYEGLSPATLYVMDAEMFKICAGLRDSRHPFFFTDSDAGQVRGYSLVEKDDCWFLYRRNPRAVGSTT